MSVAAIVIGSNDELVQRTRQALSSQSQPVAEIVNYAEVGDVSLESLGSHNWVWLLQAGMAPRVNALESLLRSSESAPSAVWLAPKLANAQNPRFLEEYGLTLTAAWAPISPAKNELDQAQHDAKQDLLAASVLGSLFRLEALTGFWNLKSRNALIRDYRLALSLRLGGFRVIGVPDAKVLTEPATTGFSKASPLNQRKTQIELFANYGNPLVVALLGLLAPLLAVMLVIWQFLLKRPERVLPTLAAGLWWFAANPVLLSRRHRLSASQRAGLKALRALRANREDVQRVAAAGFDSPVAPAELETVRLQGAVSFVGAGGPWIMALLAALSFQFWPRDVAISGGGLLPLGDSLAHLFSRAGASWQNLGLGVAMPSDPFNWVLLALGFATFWAPNLSVTVFVFLVKPLAFASAWRLLSLATNRLWVITLGALTYAFWPALTQAQNAGQLGAMLSLVMLPLFLFVLARILQFGSAGRRSVQTWTWVGSGAILAAAISAAAPSLTPLIAVSILLLALYRFRKIGYLIWLPVPLLVIWFPYAWYLVSKLGNPMVMFSDPGVAALSDPLGAFDVFLAGGSALVRTWQDTLAYAVFVPLLIALAATLTRRAVNAAWLWLVTLAAFASAAAFSRVTFDSLSAVFGSGFDGGNAGSPFPLLGLAGLVVAVLVVLALEAAPKWLSRAGQFASITAVLALALPFVLTQPSVTWGPGQTMPALVAAQAQQDSQTRVLVLQGMPSSLGSMARGTLVTGGQVTLEDQSTAYLVSQKLRRGAEYEQLSAVAANLIAGSDQGIDQGLRKFGISYVLVRDPSFQAQMSAAIDTLPQLEPVGITEFGKLWRVKSVQPKSRIAGWDWSVTKQVQVAVIGVYALLAIPTRRRVKTTTDDEAELDAFEAGFEGESF